MVRELDYFIEQERQFQEDHPDYGDMVYDDTIGEMSEKVSVVCQNHDIVSRKKKNSSINDLNQLLKDNDVIDTPTWRSIQFLGDLRNLCDHGKEREPKKEEIEDLINGTTKIMKTLFVTTQVPLT